MVTSRIQRIKPLKARYSKIVSLVRFFSCQWWIIPQSGYRAETAKMAVRLRCGSSSIKRAARVVIKIRIMRVYSKACFKRYLDML